MSIKLAPALPAAYLSFPPLHLTLEIHELRRRLINSKTKLAQGACQGLGAATHLALYSFLLFTLFCCLLLLFFAVCRPLAPSGVCAWNKAHYRALPHFRLLKKKIYFHIVLHSSLKFCAGCLLIWRITAFNETGVTRANVELWMIVKHFQTQNFVR